MFVHTQLYAIKKKRKKMYARLLFSSRRLGEMRVCFNVMFLLKCSPLWLYCWRIPLARMAGLMISSRIWPLRRAASKRRWVSGGKRAAISGGSKVDGIEDRAAAGVGWLFILSPRRLDGPELFWIVEFLPGNGAGAEWRRFDGRPMFGFLAGTGTKEELTRFDVVCPMFGFLAGTGTGAKFIRLADALPMFEYLAGAGTGAELMRSADALPMFGFLAGAGTGAELMRLADALPMFGFLAGARTGAELMRLADALPMFGFLAGARTGAELAMFDVVPPTTGADPDGAVDCLPGSDVDGPKHWKCFCTTASFSAGDLSASHQTLFLIASADGERQTGHVIICCLHLAMQS